MKIVEKNFRTTILVGNCSTGDIVEYQRVFHMVMWTPWAPGGEGVELVTLGNGEGFCLEPTVKVKKVDKATLTIGE